MAGGLRTRLLNGLLAAVVTVLALVTAAVAAQDASVRSRADTAVRAVTVGEPGCVTAAGFRGPDGRLRLVDLRRYKANCVDEQPGDEVTVYYDADDPAVHARTQTWWPRAALALLALAVAALGGRAAYRAACGAGPPVAVATGTPSGRRRTPSVFDRRARQSGTPPITATAQLYREDDAAHLVHDHAMQRLEVLRSRVATELASGPGSRSTTPHDASLTAVEQRLGSAHEALLAGRLDGVEEHFAVIARLVTDEWRADSALGNQLLDYRRAMLRG